MAKKDSTGRLSFEKDFFEGSRFSIYEDLVFALTDTKNVVIISQSDFNFLNLRNKKLEFLGNCEIDCNYLAFSLPENVDIALGNGNVYYFSILKEHYVNLTFPMICIYKQSSENESLLTTFHDILDNIKKICDGLEAYLSEDIDE